MLFALILGVIGYIAPGVIVNGRARRRGAQLVAALPDALDLLAVSVEAGLGFDAAIAKLTQHMKGPLSDEFELALGEMRIGESRVDALEEARRPRGHAGDRLVRPLDHPGRPARHLARPHPARPGGRHAATSGRRPPRSGR